MKPQDNLKILLDDVLADEPLDALRESLRLACHAELSRKHAIRHRRWIPIVAAVAVFLVMIRAFLWTGGPETDTGSLQDRPSYYVMTSPLSPDHRAAATGSDVDRVRRDARVCAEARIRTRPLAESEARVETRPLPRLARVITRTPAQRITDEELLALTDVPCGLVTTGEESKDFFFMDPEDEKRFFAKLDI